MLFARRVDGGQKACQLNEDRILVRNSNFAHLAERTLQKLELNQARIKAIYIYIYIYITQHMRAHQGLLCAIALPGTRADKQLEGGMRRGNLAFSHVLQYTQRRAVPAGIGDLEEGSVV